MTRPRKNPGQTRDSNQGLSALEAGRLTTRPTRRSTEESGGWGSVWGGGGWGCGGNLLSSRTGGEGLTS